ncbi:hypothetical protein As57867_004041, partial [Aphanomyces stellatus]
MAWAAIVACLSIYYHAIAKSRQTISDDERKILFFVHIANHNDAKRKHNHRGGVVTKFLHSIMTTFSGPKSTATGGTRTSAIAPHAADLPPTT